MEKSHFFFPIFLTGVLVVPIFANAVVFDRPLRMGDSDLLVSELQRFLNLSVETRLADAGPGSPGHETKYFGALTRKAVMKFQEKYAADILVPAGLASPTGYVGAFTLKKLNNAQLSTPPAPTPSGTSTLPTASTTAVLAPTITKLSKVGLAPGETVTITGTGFTPPLSIYFNEYAVPDPKIISETEIQAALPNALGVFLVWVSNQNGDSRAEHPMFVVTSSSSTPATVNIPQIVQTIEQQNSRVPQK